MTIFLRGNLNPLVMLNLVQHLSKKDPETSSGGRTFKWNPQPTRYAEFSVILNSFQNSTFLKKILKQVQEDDPLSNIVIARHEAIYFTKSMKEIASANEEFASQ